MSAGLLDGTRRRRRLPHSTAAARGPLRPPPAPLNVPPALVAGADGRSMCVDGHSTAAVALRPPPGSAAATGSAAPSACACWSAYHSSRQGQLHPSNTPASQKQLTSNELPGSRSAHTQLAPLLQPGLQAGWACGAAELTLFGKSAGAAQPFPAPRSKRHRPPRAAQAAGASSHVSSI